MSKSSNRFSGTLAWGLLPAMLALSTSALAGPYLAVGIGGSRLETWLGDMTDGTTNLLPNVGADAEAINNEFTSSDVGFQFNAGWRFGDYFGVEAGWVALGEQNQQYELPELCNESGCQSREWSTESETTGWQAFAVGYWPVHEKVDIYGKAGLIGWDTDFNGTERIAEFVPPPGPIGDPQNVPVAFSDDGTDLALALGLNLKTDSKVSVRTEFSWYDVDNTDQVWLLSLNAVYNF